MYLTKGDVIKHKNFKDVAIQIQNLSLQNDQLIISGTWLNQGMTKSYNINKPALFSIHTSELSNWFKCINPKAKCIRNEKWKEFKEVA